MVKVAIAGAAGRMGRTLVQAVHAHSGMQLVGAIERPDMPLLGSDAGELAGVGALGVRLVDTVAAGCARADLMIDFTAPAATLAALEHCVAAKCGMVIGTTGIDAAGRARIGAAAQHVPIMFAPNMSVGVNVLFKLVTLAAQTLGADYDIEVIEAHHKHKVDAPSGTAVRLGELMADATGRDYASAAVHGRVGQVGARKPGEIGFHAIRGGEIIGDHTVMYVGPGEQIEITHRASSRTNFAEGAMRAARWLAGRPAGLYDMQDVLGLR